MAAGTALRWSLLLGKPTCNGIGGARSSKPTDIAWRLTKECDVVHARLKAAPVQPPHEADAEERASIPVDAQPVR